MTRQFVTLYAIAHGERLDQGRSGLATAVDGIVGAPDDSGMLEVIVDAGSHEEALARVRDAIAAAGLEERFTFPAETGTQYEAPGRRSPVDDLPTEAEPPHLERGSPRPNEPGPYDPPGPEIP